MNGVQTRFKCKLDVKRCKRFVFPPSSLLPRSNALKTKAIRYFQTDRTLTRIVSPPLVRSIDFIFAQPCFDGQNLFATGISQGGALTLAAASLDHRISAAAPIVPFLSDYPDYFRLVHWPANLVFEGAARQNIDKDKIFSLLTYFDLKNLTGWIKCPVLMGFGLQDNITPPHTNFAAYNHIRTPKRWICYPTSGHFAAYENMDSWIAESTRFFNQYVVW